MILEVLKRLQKALDKLLGCEEIDVNVDIGCDCEGQFYCVYAGTEYCTKDFCNDCKLNNCRGCAFLQECIRERAI